MLLPSALKHFCSLPPASALVMLFQLRLIKVDLRDVLGMFAQRMMKSVVILYKLFLSRCLLLTVLRIRPNTDTKNLLYEANIKEWFPTRCCYFSRASYVWIIHQYHTTWLFSILSTQKILWKKKKKQEKNLWMQTCRDSQELMNVCVRLKLIMLN